MARKKQQLVLIGYWNKDKSFLTQIYGTQEEADEVAKIKSISKSTIYNNTALAKIYKKRKKK
jgi:hypothetical protein